MTEDAYIAGRGFDEPEKGSKKGGLPGPIGAKQADDAPGNPRIEVVEDDPASETHGEPLDFQERRSRSPIIIGGDFGVSGRRQIPHAFLNAGCSQGFSVSVPILPQKALEILLIRRGPRIFLVCVISLIST